MLRPARLLNGEGSRPRAGASRGGLSPREQRTLAAFAEAMAAPEGPLPAAEREIPVAAPFSELCRRLPRRQVLLMRGALTAFEWIGFPRPFSRLSLARRQAMLERLAGSSRLHHRELLMVMKTLYATSYCRDERVRAAVGYEARCEVEGDPPPAPPPLGEMEPDPAGEQCDVAIVGSGAGGAAAAVVLAEAGFDVLVLEAGPHRDRDSYPSDPLDATTSMYRAAGLTIAEGLPPIPVPAGRVVGGTTVINSGTCFRTPDAVLAEWRDRFGISWAGELGPEFEEAERMLAVTAPPLERIGRNGRLVAEGCERLGIAGAPLARNAGGCVQCSSCPQGCRLDAKRGMHVSYLPRAVAAGARIRKGLEAVQVLTEGGRAAGLRCRRCGEGEERTGRADYRVEARRAVICAGGSFGTPELLLRSGLGGAAVGRNLRLHPSTWIGARFDEPVNGWEGIMQSYGVEQWADRGVMLEATFTPFAYGGQWLPGVGHSHHERLARFDHLAANGVQVRDRASRGRVSLRRGGGLRISYRLRRAEARQIAFGMARAAEIWFAAGAREVYPQISGNPILGPADTWRLESTPPRAHDLRLESFHPMGSARLGADPASTVAGADGAGRGTRDLDIADASVFPTALGVNPMLTVIACASRIARDAAVRLS